MNFDKELDVRGQVCPFPSLRTKKTLMKMAPGQVLKVIIDYEPAVGSVQRELAKTTSHKFLETEDEDDEWNMYFQCVK